MIRHGLYELRAHPWRAVLSGVSLCAGVLAIVAIATIATVTAEVFISVREQREGRAMTIAGNTALPMTSPTALRSAVDIAQTVEAAGGGAAIVVHKSAGIATPEDVANYRPMAGPEISAVAGNLGGVRRLPLLAGRWFDSHADVPVELVLNRTAAEQWGGPGTQLMIWASRQQPPVLALVVGVIADGTGDPKFYVNLIALIHAAPTAVEATDHAQVLVHHPTASQAELNAVAIRIAAAAGGRLPEAEIGRVDTIPFVLNEMRNQQQAFTIVAIVALIVAALGILNIGLASVGERARELVIRRAIGATRPGIMGQLLIASCCVGILAAAVAVGIAIIGVEVWIPQQINPATAVEAPALPWTAVVQGLAAATGTTLLGSLVPAIVATRLDVASALRD